MIRRLYVHNYRCFENFELSLGGLDSALLIGQNGVGKSTVGFALHILSKIARGDQNRVRDVVTPLDFSRGRADVPMRFEIEIELDRAAYTYSLALELPHSFRELRVADESLTVDGSTVFSRRLADVTLPRSSAFRIDWHTIALSIIQELSPQDPLVPFRQWLSRMLILRPVAALIGGESRSEVLEPSADLSDCAAWFSGLTSQYPSAYTTIVEYLKQVMTDLAEIRNPKTGVDSKQMIVQYASRGATLLLPLDRLSDGEKMFVVCSLVLALNRALPPVFCYWDEPDSHLAPSEVGHFVMKLRADLRGGSQFLATSHHPEAIER